MVTGLQPSPHSSPRVLQGLAWLSPPSGLPSHLGGGEGAGPSLPHGTGTGTRTGTGTVSHPGPAPSPPCSAAAPGVCFLSLSSHRRPHQAGRMLIHVVWVGGKGGTRGTDSAVRTASPTRTVTMQKRLQRPLTLRPEIPSSSCLHTPPALPPPAARAGLSPPGTPHEDGHGGTGLSSEAPLPAPSSARRPSRHAPATPAPASRLGVSLLEPGPHSWPIWLGVPEGPPPSATPACQVREGLLCPPGAWSEPGSKCQAGGGSLMSPQGPATPVPVLSATVMAGLPPRRRPPGDSCSHPASPRHPVSRPLNLRLKQHTPPSLFGF